MHVRLLAAALFFVVASAGAEVSVKRGYVDNRYGQLHYTVADPGPGVVERRPTLVYFHQTPYPAIEFGAMLREMARDRRVVAVDTPGYGSSDGPDSVPEIEDYAAAITEGLANLGVGRDAPADIVGLHTGAFTAIEAAILRPEMVRSIVLVGVWYVPEERRLKAIANLPRYRTTDEFFDWFHAARPRLRQRQLGQNVTDEQWGRIMVESLRSLTKREYGHDAAFAYAARLRDRAKLVRQPVLLVALDDGTRQETLDSRPLFSNVQLADFPHLQEGAFFNDAPELARAFRAFLDPLSSRAAR